MSLSSNISEKAALMGASGAIWGVIKRTGEVGR